MSEEQKMKIRNTLKGRKRPEEARRNISNALKGRKCPSVSKRMKQLVREKNPSWKGDDVSNSGLHKHISKYLPKPQTCHLCNKVPPRDVACITGIYNREFKNWAWFCKKCHVKYDNIIPRLVLNRVYKNKIGRKSGMVKMKMTTNNNNTAADELIKLGNEIREKGQKIMKMGDDIDLSNLSKEEVKTLKKLLDKYKILFDAKSRELNKLWMKIAEIEKETFKND